MARTQLSVAANGKMTRHETKEVVALYAEVLKVLDTECANGKKIGDCQHGVYLFYDYDSEPIYVGQTAENLRGRIYRHLTNQRTDAVAMSVLDPFEVAEIEMWPFWNLSGNAQETLRQAEFTVYRQALQASAFNIILNEKEIPETELIDLPASVRAQILPPGERRQHEPPDLRLARRAQTISNLAQVISERKVRVGIRRTLWAQSQRLERLAQTRLKAFNGEEEDEK